MSGQRYPWKRFWCARGETFNLSDGGFLVDPDAGTGAIFNPSLVSTEALLEHPCAILLGEPGIGKTSCIDEMQETQRKKVADGSDRILAFNLRSFRSEERLIHAVFNNSAVEAWTSRDYLLHLFLDSFDECLLRIDTLAILLGEELAKLPVQRLRLRIACRTAEWPSVLESLLIKKYGGSNVKAFELVPLRRVDVEQSVSTNGFDPSRFIGDVAALHLEPLAIKPVTLQFLLNAYKKWGRFPPDQNQLYLDGCRILCEETSATRKDAQLTADQRLALAMRIAAVTIFSNRYAVWTGLDLGDVPEEDVTVRELSGSFERVGSDEVPATEVAVREVLGTALFSSRGVDRMGWAHQTYAEFLAATYLTDRLSLNQIQSLIINSADSEHKVVPQLAETAAWIANLNTAVFDQIISNDPEILLRSAVSKTLRGDREKLVSSLFQMSEEEKLIPFDIAIHSDLSGLGHPTLTDQLRPYLVDRTKHESSRHLAIHIAKACRAVNLSRECASIALDASEVLSLRINATSAVALIGDDDSRQRLKPLARGDHEKDPEDELKGYALDALWPDFLSADELFADLTPRDPSFFGGYFRFITSTLPKQIREADLPAGLRWIEERANRATAEHEFAELDEALLSRAFDNLDKEEIADRMAKTVLLRFRAFHQVFSRSGSGSSNFRDKVTRDTHKRRLLMLRVMAQLQNADNDPFYLVFCDPPLAIREDFFWLLDILKKSTSEHIKRLVANTIARIWDWTIRDQLDAVLVACTTEPVMAHVFSWLITPIELGSEQANYLKARYKEETELELRAKTRPLVDPPPTTRVRALLDRSEGGEPDVWWMLCRELTLEPTSTHYGDSFEPDVTTFPGWAAADLPTKSRIMDAAKRFVSEREPQLADKSFGTGRYDLRDLAGCKALYLLCKELRGFFDTIDEAVWKKWAAEVLGYPRHFGDTDIGAVVIQSAYKNASHEVLSALNALIDYELKETHSVSILEAMKPCWDNAVAGVVRQKLTQPGLDAASFGALLYVLLSQSDQEARVFAESFLTVGSVSSPETRERTAVAARTVIMLADDAGWSKVWPLFEHDPEFGSDVIESVSFPPDPHGNFLAKLRDLDLAKLYIWLVSRYPYSTGDRGAAGFMGPMHTVRMLRDGALTVLKQRGTRESVSALAYVVSELPQYSWLKFHLIEARQIARTRTWTSPAPGDVLRLARQDDLRLIENGTELLNVIVESLEHLQAKLHAEVPAVQFLWNKVTNKVFRPCDENALSDYVKLHLDDDLQKRGVVINREVRIHRGERTDIHVDAVKQLSGSDIYDVITAIVEVKGSWNPELDTAIHTQLVGQYLRGNRCEHGLYLVGWFSSDQWDESDNRHKQNPKISINEVKKRFNEQATEVSKDLVVRAYVLDAHL
jgi:predicted NACHT family NTPase